jgi:asparagine synthase (glutamine-hydrolysing)
MVRLTRGQKPDIRSIFVLNLDEQTREGNTLRANGRELAALFSGACRARAGGSPNVLSLSGGLDSRAVAAALATSSTPFCLASFDDGGPRSRNDIRVGHQIAKKLGLAYDVFETPRPAGRDLSRLLRMTAGLNSAAMAFILFFFDHLRATHGEQLNYFTGDGGDKALPLLTAPMRMRDHQHLASYILGRSSIFYAERASALAGVSSSELVDHLTGLLTTYPESSIERKYTHFLLYERARNWLFDGEDRNRAYFTSVAPFYAPGFMRAAQSCPENQKRHMALYREFLLALSRELAVVPYANAGTSITSFRFRATSAARHTAEQWFNLRALKSRWHKFRPGAGGLPSRFAILAEIRGRFPVVRSSFPEDVFEDFCTSPQRYTGHGERAYSNLLTLFWNYVYFLENRDMLAEDYADLTF